ncbi:TPA: acyltransferase family protein [Raoultella planticola ATCC 33531]
MKLSEVLKKDNNNIDLFRVIAACMVIYGHAYAISPQPGKTDFISHLIPSDYSGSLAVKIFFFLSGLVVTNSLINNGDLVRFTISRLFRIWPALIASSLVTAFIIGPLLTSLSVTDYLSRPEVYSYTWNIAAMVPQFTLPGLFSGNPYPNVVNGSLWTIPYEVFAYVLLFSLYATGLLNSKKLSILLFALILLEPFLASRILFPWVIPNPEVDFLSPCFAFGAIMALNREIIEIKLSHCLGFATLYYILQGTVYSPYFAYASIFLSLLYISSHKMILRLKPKVDISYGVYLWGFPVQQIIAKYFKDHGILFNQSASLVAALFLGYLSWHLCEKHFIRFGSALSSFIKKAKAPVINIPTNHDLGT